MWWMTDTNIQKRGWSPGTDPSSIVGASRCTYEGLASGFVASFLVPGDQGEADRQVWDPVCAQLDQLASPNLESGNPATGPSASSRVLFSFAAAGRGDRCSSQLTDADPMVLDPRPLVWPLRGIMDHIW